MIGRKIMKNVKSTQNINLVGKSLGTNTTQILTQPTKAYHSRLNH